MDRYTVISATNRPDNRTYSFAEVCKKLLEKRSLPVELFSLIDIPPSFMLHNMYDFETSPLLPIVEKYITPAHKFIFILPEYNGSYPGILKVMLDSLPQGYFEGKKALLIGTSTGRAGNLRGMDHFTAVLHYLKTEVYSQKLPISSIHKMIDEQGRIMDDSTVQLIDRHIDDFVRF